MSVTHLSTEYLVTKASEESQLAKEEIVSLLALEDPAGMACLFRAADRVRRLEVLAEDILLLKRLDVAMAGIGPFIPNPHTPLGGASRHHRDDLEISCRGQTSHTGGDASGNDRHRNLRPIRASEGSHGRGQCGHAQCHPA